MKGLSREEKAYEISKEVLFYGATGAALWIMHSRLNFGWGPAVVATAGASAVAYVTASVFQRGHLPRSLRGMVQNSQGVTRPIEPGVRAGVILVPGSGPVPDDGAPSGDLPADPGPLGPSGLRQP